MLMLKVGDDGSWEELYYGDFEPRAGGFNNYEFLG